MQMAAHDDAGAAGRLKRLRDAQAALNALQYDDRCHEQLTMLADNVPGAHEAILKCAATVQNCSVLASALSDGRGYAYISELVAERRLHDAAAASAAACAAAAPAALSEKLTALFGNVGDARC